MVGNVFSTMKTVSRNPYVRTAAGITTLGMVPTAAKILDPENKHSTAKKVIGFTAAAALLTAGLVYGAKTGNFTKLAGKAAEYANQFKGSDNFIKKYAAKALPLAEKGLNKLNTAGTQVGKFIAETVPTYAKKGVDFVKDFFLKKA